MAFDESRLYGGTGFEAFEAVQVAEESANAISWKRTVISGAKLFMT